MKRRGKTLLSLAGTLVLASGVQADVADGSVAPEPVNDQPYSAIWVRNVFDLKPPPPPPSNVASNTPPANIKLLGISTMLGNKRAILSVQEVAGPGRPPGKEQSYVMTEGQRQGPLEVLEIDPPNRKVKIKNEELVSTITFDTNKTSIGSAPGAPPAPAFTPPGFNPPRPNIGNRPGGFLPPRMTMPPPVPTAGNPAGTVNGFAPGFSQNPQAQAQVDNNAAALAALRQQQAEQAQEAQNAAQSLPTPGKTPLNFGARVTGTYKNQ